MADNIVDLLICGDTVLINRAEGLCLDKNASLISKEMMKHFSDADIVMANLEAPIIEDGKAIKKCGPNLSIKQKCIHQINKIGIDVFNLANNHIMDYGSSGLTSTTNILSSNNISFYGAGSNEKDASTLLIKTINNITPKILEGVFLADNAVVIGDVIIGKQSSVWYNTVIRGDVNSIIIGNSVNIQDGVVVHCTYQKTKTIIGDNVSIGHNAVIHGCEIKNNVLTDVYYIIGV